MKEINIKLTKKKISCPAKFHFIQSTYLFEQLAAWQEIFFRERIRNKKVAFSRVAVAIFYSRDKTNENFFLITLYGGRLSG